MLARPHLWQQPLYTIRMPQREKTKSEIEIKLRVTNLPEILHKIKNLRAARHLRLREQNTLYDTPQSHLRLPNLHLDLDETPAGIFLELEGNPKAIDGAAQSLGFTKKAYLRATYWDLYAAACRRRGTKPKNMLFSAK